MRHVRAKFRCMAVTHEWDDTWTFKFLPVLQQGKNPENAEFWKFTPSGDAELKFRGPALDNRGEQYKPGDYYYIDMLKSPNEKLDFLPNGAGWCLTTVTYNGKDTGHIELNTNGKTTVDWTEKGFAHGTLKMGIDNPAAFIAFDEAGANWDVQFTWAEASED